MHLAMDDFGDDCFLEIKRLNGEANKWNKIYEIASNYGFAGIQLNQKVYNEQLGLSLRRIPGFLNKFRLTYHIGGVSILATDEDYSDLSNKISESLEISDAFGIEDVSFHPPLINEENEAIRDISKKYLDRLIEHWLPRFQDKKGAETTTSGLSVYIAVTKQGATLARRA